nr:hypothetical protein [Mimivirus sp.]
MEFLILLVTSLTMLLAILMAILFVVFFVVGSVKLYKYLSFWKKIVFLSVLFCAGFAIIFALASPMIIITYNNDLYGKTCNGLIECNSPTKCFCRHRTLYGYIKLYCWNDLEKCLMINWDYLINSIFSAMVYPFCIMIFSLPPMGMVVGNPIIINNQCSNYNNVHHHIN